MNVKLRGRCAVLQIILCLDSRDFFTEVPQEIPNEIYIKFPKCITSYSRKKLKKDENHFTPKKIQFYTYTSWMLVSKHGKAIMMFTNEVFNVCFKDSIKRTVFKVIRRHRSHNHLHNNCLPPKNCSIIRIYKGMNIRMFNVQG